MPGNQQQTGADPARGGGGFCGPGAGAALLPVPCDGRPRPEGPDTRRSAARGRQFPALPRPAAV